MMGMMRVSNFLTNRVSSAFADDLVWSSSVFGLVVSRISNEDDVFFSIDMDDSLRNERRTSARA